MANPDPNPAAARQYDLPYAVLLFAIAVLVVGFAIDRQGLLAGSPGWGTAVFFVAYGLFTITVGFPHPGFGHVSFDRVAQIASLLVLGPVDAAWINGVASLIYPWHRLRSGTPLRTVLTASLHNAGLMSLAILGCGQAYVMLGGPVPPVDLNLRTVGLLLFLMLAMQVVNDLGMMVLFRMRRVSPSKVLNIFTTGLELSSGLVAILVALAWVNFDGPFFVLLLLVLSLGMLALKNYAVIRIRLEALVDERTEELRLKSIELERQATHDKLTGLYNRRYADDYLQREIENAHRYGREFTIALADIDHFKSINDRFSHAVGDRVLARIAEILVSRCRKTDMVARYGGEEFLICFPDTSTEFAEQICSQIRLAVEEANWSGIHPGIPEAIDITISFGIAEIGDDSRRTTVLSEADTRLYKAKHGGRNRVVV
ncbi:MAG: GGDEF domain-containing protein [Gammaproteobacteria bacterium]|nr:GGDEF domain-containing protein [Gammaproteobacteria bacterium]MDH4255213.1 GGDEF domain-containing protein [Gammaproteobacteria bacterium]MDH5308769.1 GGDEF domain-containing protein [Gammaproteobacteria bacterium]